MSLARKSLLGLAIISALGVAVGLIGVERLGAVEARLNAITDVTAPIVETTDDLIRQVGEMHKVGVEVLADEDLADIDGRMAEFEIAKAAFDAAADELRALALPADIAGMFDVALAGRDPFLATVAAMRDAHVDDLEALALASARRDQFDATGDELLAKLGALAATNETEMANAEEEADRLVASGRATVGRLNDLIGALFEEDYPAVEASFRLQVIVEQLEGVAEVYLSVDDPADLPDWRARFAAIAADAQPWFDTLIAVSESDAERVALRDLENVFDNWISEAGEEDQLFDAHDEGLEHENAADLFAEEMDDAADNLIAALNAIADAGDATNDAADEAAAKTVGLANALILGGVAGLIGAAAVVGLFLYRRILAPLRGMAAAMEGLAAGDAAIDVAGEDRDDEVGAMARSVAVFKRNALERMRLEAEQRAAQEERLRRAEKIEGLVAGFDDAATTVLEALAASSGRLDATAETMGRAAERSTARLATVAASTEQAAANVGAVAASADEMASSIAEIRGQVGRSRDIAEQARSEAEGAATGIQQLVDRADDVGRVVGLINEIAEQTNLLALNATIEAARAGDAGKGFAVVANEVKALAAQTAKATNEISDQITSMQSDTARAAAGIRQASGIVEQMSEIAVAVASAIEQQDASTGEISRNITQAATGSNDVAAAITEVTKTSREAGDAAEQVLDSARELAEKTAGLRAEMSAFLDGLQAA